jgi:hypothetical protein
MILPDAFLWKDLLQAMIEEALNPCHHIQKHEISDTGQKTYAL